MPHARIIYDDHLPLRHIELGLIREEDSSPLLKGPSLSCMEPQDPILKILFEKDRTLRRADLPACRQPLCTHHLTAQLQLHAITGWL